MLLQHKNDCFISGVTLKDDLSLQTSNYPPICILDVS